MHLTEQVAGEIAEVRSQELTLGLVGAGGGFCDERGLEQGTVHLVPGVTHLVVVTIPCVEVQAAPGTEVIPVSTARGAHHDIRGVLLHGEPVALSAGEAVELFIYRSERGRRGSASGGYGCDLIGFAQLRIKLAAG